MPDKEYSSAKEARRDISRLKRAEVRTKTSGRAKELETAATEQIRVRESSEAARRITSAQRASLRKEEISHRVKERLATQKELDSERRVNRAKNAVVFGTANTVTQSSTGHTLGMVFGLFFLMIIIYIIVTHGSEFGKFTGGIGNFIAGLSSNAAIFQKNES